ncbi:hypothetical protein D0Z03_002991 [Geotrichum reessii]|nr:hypothetical protein D0Z03_002991 [Galactomyces reessii]
MSTAERSNILFSKARASVVAAGRSNSSPLLNILSPPMSPYPDSELPESPSSIKPQLTLRQPFKTINTTTANSTVSTPQTTESFLKKLHEPKKQALRAQFADYRLEKFSADASLVACCWSELKSNPHSYLARERSFHNLYSRHRPSSANYTVTAHAVRKPKPRQKRADFIRQLAPRQSVRNVVNSSLAAAAALNNFSATSSSNSSSGIDNNTSSNNSSNALSSSPSTTVSIPTPASTPRKPRTQTSANKVHDMNFDQLQDFAPPVSTLPAGKTLRAEWKGAPMDLSQDPNLHLLHPAEVQLAAVLRLPADIYIDSKKRLFAEKVYRLRQGLPFRRTDSQKACRIDVNKASRLFTAYEKVGWLDDALFEKYL